MVDMSANIVSYSDALFKTEEITFTATVEYF